MINETGCIKQSIGIAKIYKNVAFYSKTGVVKWETAFEFYESAMAQSNDYMGVRGKL